jgi:SAM-dependent methyltransferase
MFSHIWQVLSEIENSSDVKSIDSVLPQIRKLCLDDFGEVLLNLPNAELPKLSNIFPKMAAEDIQKNWTGSSGYPLLRQSLNFVRLVSHAYENITGKDFSNRTILDYGCGYGRLLRLMLYFTAPEKLYGCDPWDKSIEICRLDRIPCDLQITDYLPTALPYQNKFFDFIYAFSVFTHTSERATKFALSALREIASDNAVLAITIRPIEYWDFDKTIPEQERSRLVRDHNEKGFAFRPHNRSSIDGDITYGDTSISIHYLKRSFPSWNFVKMERTLEDPFQLIMYFRAA